MFGHAASFLADEEHDDWSQSTFMTSEYRCRCS